MKKALSRFLVLIAAVFITATPTAYAQQSGSDTNAKVNNAKAETTPRLSLPFTSFDFGNVYKGEIISQVFLIQNHGNADLIVKGIVPNCGCEAVSTDKVISPGKSGKARIEINTSVMFGSIYKTAILYTNDPERPSVMLSLTANVLANPDGTPLSNAVVRQGKHIGPIFLAPDDRGALIAYQGGKAATEFTITVEQGSLKILRVEGGEDVLNSRVESVEEGKKFKLILEPISTEKAGGKDVTLLVTTDSPVLPSFPIMVRFSVRARD